MTAKMDKEEMAKTAAEQETAASETERKPTNKERFNSMMMERMQGYNPDDEEGAYGMLIDDYTKSDEQKKILSDAINQDPRLAQVLSDIVSGKRSSGNALVRYYGRDFLSAEEGTPEYEDIAAAEEERKKEAEDRAARESEYKSNMDASTPIIEEFCKKKGYEVDDFLDKVWDQIASPILSGKYTPELLEMMDKAFNYDTDVSDALKAGEVKGRNENVNKMRNDKIGDGLPTGLGTNTKQTKKPKQKQETILDIAKYA